VSKLQAYEYFLTKVCFCSFQHYRNVVAFYALLAYRRIWWSDYRPSRFQLLEPILENVLQKANLSENSILRSALFTGMVSAIEFSCVYWRINVEFFSRPPMRVRYMVLVITPSAICKRRSSIE